MKQRNNDILRKNEFASPKYVMNILVMLLLLLTSGCLNRFEADIVGDYRIDSFKVINNPISDLPRMSLLKNKTFVLKYKQRIYNGDWFAEDDGDHTLIYLKSKEVDCQGFVFGGSVATDITFYNPWTLKMNDFSYPKFRKKMQP